MKIWMDGDACPGVIKEILYRASQRTQTELICVSNKYFKIPKSKFIKFIVVESSSDAADERIVDDMESGDLVVTADIPLASNVIVKGGLALNPRGELYTTENIKAKLHMRDFMDSLRGSGIETGGAPPFSVKNREAFANNLDRILTKYLKQKG